MDYINTPIKKIGRVVTGKTPSTAVQEYYNGDIMFITPSELHTDFIVEKSEKTITSAGFDSIRANTISGTSVMVGCIGWDMGNVAICQETCATNQQINSVTDIKPIYNPLYLYYWLKTKKDYLFSIASVTRTPILNKSTFEDVLVPMPKRNAQDAVVNLLSVIDNKIMLNNRINNNLFNQLQTLYHYWFTQFSYKTSNIEANNVFVWSDKLKSKIPNGWKCCNIKDITAITWGQCPDGKNILDKSTVGEDLLDYCSGAGDMKGGFLVDCQAKTNNSKRLAHKNDILISIAGKIGDICVVDHTISLGRAAMAFTANDYNELPFIYMTLYVLNKKMITISTGSIQKVINNDHIEEFNFPYNKEIVYEFGEITLPVFEKMVDLAKENKKLIAVRDWLLPMLMNGQATVQD